MVHKLSSNKSKPANINRVKSISSIVKQEATKDNQGKVRTAAVQRIMKHI